MRCSGYVLRPNGPPVAIPGTMRQVVRDALDPKTGTADAEMVLADVEAVVNGCLGYVHVYMWGGWVCTEQTHALSSPDEYE